MCHASPVGEYESVGDVFRDGRARGGVVRVVRNCPPVVMRRPPPARELKWLFIVGEGPGLVCCRVVGSVFSEPLGGKSPPLKLLIPPQNAPDVFPIDNYCRHVTVTCL